MSDLPRRAVSRTARLATLPLGFGARAAWGLGRRIGGRPAEVVAAELQQQTAEQLFKVLGTLKGGAMKFGQALSMLESAVPEELAGPYRATLTRLQDSAPAMPTATVHKILRQELGEHWRDQFAEFEDQPRAAASIGQVHHATLPDGRPVAVKVQYPGAGDALMSDLNQLSLVARMTTSWLPGLDVGPILDELKERMAEETDYQLEAAMQEQFAAAYEGDPNYVLPRVISQSKSVIVSEWVDGTPLSRIIASGTKRQRDVVADRYLRFLLGGPDRAGLLHADPHPGNFRLLDDDRLGVLDFGAVNRLPEGLPPQLGRLVTIGLSGDAEDVLEGLRDEGFVRSNVDLDAHDVLDYLNIFLEPLRSDRFTFERPWIRQAFAKINDPRSERFRVGLRLNLPPQYLLIHRTWLGGIAVLCQIGGTVPARQIFDECVESADLPPLSG